MVDHSPKLIQEVFNHIVLPPRLPDQHDRNVGQLNSEIILRAIRAADALCLLQQPESSDIWGGVKRSLGLCDATHEDDQLDRDQLLQAFHQVEQNTSLIVHIAAQNAGLLIQPTDANDHGIKQVLLECFEASPSASSVLSCPGALICEYPGNAVAISMDVFNNRPFQEALAVFLEQASGEVIEKFAPRAKKAGTCVIEPRDTAAPYLITQMLMAFLEAQGCRVSPRRIQKKVRDDVCWSNAYLPWRRSPFYMVIRVCVERLLHAMCGPEAGLSSYKLFISMMHYHLLLDSERVLSFESRHFLLAKLCRRLAKSKVELKKKKKLLEVPITHLSDACSLKFFNGVSYVALKMEAEWSAFKHSIQKRIPSLPFRANDQDTHLQLPNSGPHIESMLRAKVRRRKTAIVAQTAANNLDKRISQPYREFARTYYDLHHLESELHQDLATTATAKGNNDAHGVRLLNGVGRYLDQVSKLLDTPGEEKSIMMLFLFEHWVALDQHMVCEFPLLREYSSAFLSELLDVLQLASYEDMKRLSRIQVYLSMRQKHCSFKTLTLFSHPVANGFSDRYTRYSPDAPRLERLRSTIEAASQAARAAKTAELGRINDQYRTLSRKIESLPCTRKTKKEGSSCAHCRAKRQRKKLGITAHEDFLPEGGVGNAGVRQRAVIFEIAMPPALAKYRDVTWRIITLLGLSENILSTRGSPARAILDRYNPLQPYIGHRGLKFHLASRTKSFLVSHYKGCKLPVSTSQVLLPFGLDLAYYDTQEGIWASDLPTKMTFAHHFSLNGSLLTLLNSGTDDFVADGEGRSSYEIIAAHDECPLELTVHEYTTYQSLLTGKAARWLSLLRELGSSNLNFSLEPTMHLVSYLALQVGPNSTDRILRDIHQIFNDARFCLQLALQVESILSRICSSWREVYCMEMLLNLILRLCNLGSGQSKKRGFQLLHRVRLITSDWCQKLRFEIQRGVLFEMVQQLSRYALMAGLICKRTFAASEDETFEPDNLQIFFEACLTIQENIQDPSQLSEMVRGLFVRDFRMTSSMAAVIRKLLTDQSSCLERAIEKAWPDVPNGQREYSTWRAVKGSKWWIEAHVAATEYSRAQVVHYHGLEGHLLVDRNPIGRLPPELRDSPIVQDIFEKEHLMIFPSAMVGMEFTLACLRNGHQVHFGKFENEIAIQVRVRDSVLRLVHRQYFGTGPQADLPLPLISNCFHWLDIKSRHLEVRRRKHMWMFRRQGNWMLDMRTRHASRGQVLLVDPHSQLFKQVATVFQGFEDVERLTVFQPRVRNLSVELKRMDLDFTVNAEGYLLCRQLQAEIDPDQDAGTWYGLQSKIILRDSANHLKRSIIVPIGPLSYNRHGPHVQVIALNNGRYGRYQIDDILGRLKCEPEPLLIYTKSLLHAFTSFPLPDSLTGRTGTEEALASLTSAMSQPWSSLGPAHAQPLIALAELTPRRYYYPEHEKCQQQVLWNEHLTVTIQHEQYRSLIEKLGERLDRLAKFSLHECHRLSLEPGGAAELTHRSYLRRQNFMRSRYSLDSFSPEAENKPYSSRDKHNRSPSTSQTYEVASVLRHASSQFVSTTSLMDRFEQCTYISGYSTEYHKDSITDILETDIVSNWGGLVNICRQYQVGRYDIALELATIASAERVNMDLLRVLTAFCILPELQNLRLPEFPGFSGFIMHEKPSRESILLQIKEDYGEVSNKYHPSLQKTLSHYRERFERECCIIADEVCNQWPHRELDLSHIPTATIDYAKVVNNIGPEWSRLVENCSFSESLVDIQRVLDANDTGSVFPARPDSDTDTTPAYPIPPRPRVIPDIQSLILKDGPHKPSLIKQSQLPPSEQVWSDIKSPITSRCKENSRRQPKVSPGGGAEIRTIIEELTTSRSMLRQKYGDNLMSSLNSLECVFAQEVLTRSVPTPNNLESVIARTREKADMQLQAIHASLSKSDVRHEWLSSAHLWPCLTPVTILQQIRSSAQRCFGQGMKEAVIEYGVSLTHLQQLLRIYDALRKQDAQRLQAEQSNRGHENWEPVDFPDWLLMEIDTDILIRQTQVDVARATISPASNSNSVLQMNMGQGKTSVVTPIVLCALANGRTLVRLVVPESLLLQTAQTMQSCLGELVGREVLNIPFARKSPIDVKSIREYRAFHEEMLQRFGIILTIPQHVLSFKLNGLQCIADARFQSAGAILSTNAWMMGVCRDIIDESDFSLGVQTQLIYPSGSQALVDGHPQRWKTAHILLGTLESLVLRIEEGFTSSLDVVRRPNGGFPIIHILRPDMEERLTQMLVDELCSERSPIPFLSKHYDDMTLIKRFISHTNVEHSTIQLIKDNFVDHPADLKTLFLLRGLVGHGILLVCLKKRWNVQYGLHRNRSPIAVPFRAKGVPSEQAEWGHPDVAIVLTCLAFYYDGLSLEQLRQCLQSLSQSDDPQNQYNSWISYSDTLPQTLRHWNLININDQVQVREIWLYLRYVTMIINFFLDHYVFPVHAKQFSTRLQMSGWDLPLFDLNHCTPGAKQVLTTGFSGTNDDRFILPLTIHQNDLSALFHTNAEVLEYLLQPRNRSYVVAANSHGKHLSEVDVLRKLNNMGVRILIDAGAHILELDNRSLVREWLAIDHQAPAAVYFDATNKPWVVDRNEAEVPLLASSFARDLRNCLVYLDHAHTRGTDLKFPPAARGALTLSLGQTKDQTVQAAMRLRQLGTSQSVTFLASPETHQSILDHRRKTYSDPVDSGDVVSWLLEQTCRHHEQLQSLYVAQGYDFCRRMEAESSYRHFVTDPRHRQALVAAITQREQHDLEKVYAYHRPTSISPVDHTFKHARIAQFATALHQEQLSADSIGPAPVLAFAEVEQEREMISQIEQVRNVQCPTRRKHHTFPGLHANIRNFALHGCLKGVQGYESAFSALRRTVPGRKHGLRPISQSKLFVSSEFTRTVDIKPGEWLTDFLRPVHWILWSPSTETALIIIPEEVECVIPLIMADQTTATHLLIYAAAFTKGMIHFNSLNFYALPALPRDHQFPSALLVELGILAGRLFCTYEEYRTILKYLGSEGSECGDDNTRSAPEVVLGTIADDALGFLQEWLSMTRTGREFSHTPMGYICRNRRLERDHTHFAPVNLEVSAHLREAINIGESSRSDTYGSEEGEVPDSHYLLSSEKPVGDSH